MARLRDRPRENERETPSMGMNDTALMGMVTEKMTWLTQRQRVIGQNIANADTPDYQAQKIADIDFERALRGQQQPLKLVATDPSHVASPTSQASFRVREDRAPYETAPAGNDVVLEEQMMQMQETAGDYEFVTNLYRKFIGLQRTAIGRAGGG